MLTIFVWVLFTQCVLGQLNGEFWWLNSKVSELNGKTIPPPQYDDLTEFDTDDTRILFNEHFNAMKRKIINNPNNKRQFKLKPNPPQSKKNKMVNTQDRIIFSDTKDKNKFVWPSDDGRNKNKLSNVASTHHFSNNDQTTKKITVARTTQVPFAIKFPERDTFYVPEPTKTLSSTVNNNTTAQVFESTPQSATNFTDALVFTTTYNTENKKETKNICTYIKRHECKNNNGFIYTAEYGKSLKIGPKDPTLICCVLTMPLKNSNENIPVNISDDILYFPDKTLSHKRAKRSNDDLRQRNVLLQRRRNKETKTKSVPIEIVATEDGDPYWNIKNSFNPTIKPTKAMDYDYNEDYAKEYADELPRPGLLGIYSESDRKPNNWAVVTQDKTYGGDDDNDDVDDTDTSFGYATIDPREGLTKPKKRIIPIKLTTSEEKYDPESQIINVQSHPNFEVLQGFKLLNLVRNKHKMSKTNEKPEHNEDQGSVVSSVLTSSEYADDLKENSPLFGNCGKTTMKLKQKDAEVGDAAEGSHPWLVVVTPVADNTDVLCYGTLVHPRAALTAADCVAGISSNGITVLAGLWKLNDKTNVKKRSPQVHLHPKYKPGNVANNLAVLTWSRPLKLCDDVQTACLAESRQGNDCMLYGWGGFDQALRLRSRWQKATLEECSQMSSTRKSSLPSNAFCATVQSRGTVSGVGGPLVCNVNGRAAVVGVGVSRDTDIVFLPAKEWAMEALQFVDED